MMNCLSTDSEQLCEKCTMNMQKDVGLKHGPTKTVLLAT